MLRMRPLLDDEVSVLKKIAHRSRDGVQRTRAKVIREMARTGKVSMAARVGGVSPQYARQIIERFGDVGLGSLPAKHAGGRARLLSSQYAEPLKLLASQHPGALGLPWTC